MMLERTKADFWIRDRTKVLAALLATATFVFASSAHAQDAQSTAAAEALFGDARKLMSSGKMVEACPKLEESERLAPAVGTLLNLGICYEKSHRPASAWATFKEAVSAARASGQSEREHLAQKYADSLDGKISHLTLRVPPAMRGASIVVRRDGVIVAPAAWGSAMPLDPGAHRIDVTAPARVAWSTTVTLAEDGGAAEVSIPELAAAPVNASRLVTSRSNAATPSATPAAPSSAQRIAGLVTAGFGLAGVATGVVFGAVAKSKNDDALANHCGGGTTCDSQGVALTSDARSAATISTISFVGGGAALVTGAVLFFTSPKRSSTRTGVTASPTLSAHSAGFSLGGTW